MKLDQPYEYRQVLISQKKTIKVAGESYEVIEHVFIFKDSKAEKFKAILEEYPEKIFALKFYPKSRSKDRENQFKKLTNFNRPFRLLATLFKISLDFYESEPFASFCFVGAELYEKEDSLKETKRFRVWSRVVADQVSPKNFSHHKYPEKSAYLLVNKNYIKERHSKSGMVKELEKVFDDFLDNYFEVSEQI